VKKLKIKCLNISDHDRQFCIHLFFLLHIIHILSKDSISFYLFLFNDRLCKQHCITRNFIRAQRSSDLSKRYFRAIPTCNFRRQRRRLHVSTACFAMTWEFLENLTLLQSQSWIWYSFDEHVYIKYQRYILLVFYSFNFSKNSAAHYCITVKLLWNMLMHNDYRLPSVTYDN